MHRRPCRLALPLTSLLLVVAPVSAALAAAPPAKPADGAAEKPAPGSWEARMAAIKAWRDALRAEGKRPDPAETEKVVREALAGADFSTLTLDQIRASWNSVAGVAEFRDAILARARTLAADRGADGGAAAFFLANMGAMDEKEEAALAKAAFDHPGLEAHLEKAGLAARAQATNLLQSLPPEERAAYAAKALEWAKHFSPATPPKDFRSSVSYLNALREVKDAVGAERFEAARASVLAAAQAAATKAREAGRTDDAAALDKLAKRLDSPAMKGLLIGAPAPALTLKWIHDRNGTPSWTSLDDLKGKVVVLDFWATWCGPCVASFPNVRELRSHYSPDDVVILGVTSLQGAHYWKQNEAKPDRPSKVDTKDNPTLEQQLMTEYMDEMDITWPVAFSEQEVFNLDYDVSGIPHVAIIDAKGVLRYNNLHPAVPLKEKTDKIDALLKEAGKTPPAAPTEQKKE